MRKLKPLLLALLFVPAAAYALGLGDIRLSSSLHQPLSAEIDLLSVSPDDIPTIEVSLASHEAFAQLGIDRPVALMALQFTVEQRSNGSYFVRATSQRPVSEPFLDFLLEVNWRSGRLLREYTVLLDPPELMQKEAPPAVRAPAVRAPAVIEPAVSEPAITEPAVEPAVSAPAASETAATPEATADGAAQSTPATGEGAVAAPSQIPKRVAPVRNAARTYGPVKGNETLWSIANQMRRGTGASVPQVMVALLKGNPQSFEENNVNRLKAGTVLRLDPATLKAMSQAEAAREVARQDRQWQDFKQKAAGEAASRAPTGETAVPRSAAAAVKKSEPRLKLVAPEAAKPGKADASGTATDAAKMLESLKKELMLAQEAGEAGKQENQELRKRVEDLEGQIKSMERLLTLKDDDLAALQRKLSEEARKSAAVPQPPAVAQAKPAQAKPAQAKPADAPAPMGAADGAVPAPAAIGPTAGPVPAAGEAPAATESPAATDAPAAAQGTVTEPTPAQSGAAPTPKAGEAPQDGSVPASEPAPVAATKKPAPKKKPVVPVAPPPEPSLFDSLLSNPLYAGVVLVIGLVIAGVAIRVVRRRRGGGNFTESILMGGTPSMMKAKAAEGKTEESSFFSDFAVSGMGDIQAEDSEVDPLTEADVYMAYQRYQQAEDLVKDALKHNPERPELHLKLLEVYHATQDKAKFEAGAVKLHGLVNGSGPVWNKVLAMGHGLLPAHPLFAKAPQATGAADHADARLDNEVLDIGLDLDALTEEMESGGGGGNGFIDLGVDFSDLEDQKPRTQAAPAAKKGAAPAAAPVEEPGFDLDLDALIAQPESATASASVQEPSFDFDLDALTAQPEAAPAPKAAAAPSAKSDLDFDLSSLSLMGSETAADSSSSGKEKGALELESFDLGSLDLASMDAEPTGELNIADLAMPGDNGSDLLLGEINEVETKLDLARAYVDMGDGEGARNLLDEVMQEGDATQKQQAQEILKKIA